MNNLRERNNITVSDAGIITLTDSGRQIAEMIYDRHELLSECLETVSYTHLDVYKRQLYRGLGWEIISNKMTYVIKDRQIPTKLKEPGYVRRVQWLSLIHI